jgi:hypothetical protein
MRLPSGCKRSLHMPHLPTVLFAKFPPSLEMPGKVHIETTSPRPGPLFSRRAHAHRRTPDSSRQHRRASHNERHFDPAC